MKTSNTLQDLDRPARGQRYVVRYWWRNGETTCYGQSASGITLAAAKEVCRDLAAVSGITDSSIEPVG